MTDAGKNHFIFSYIRTRSFPVVSVKEPWTQFLTLLSNFFFFLFFPMRNVNLIEKKNWANLEFLQDSCLVFLWLWGTIEYIYHLGKEGPTSFYI